MHAQIIPLPTTAAEPDQRLTVVSSTAIAAAAAAADTAAAAHVFEDYRSRKAQNTITAHDQDLERLAAFLQHAEVQLAGDLTSEPVAWSGITWGIVEAFNRWQLAEGYAISSIGRALATIKA